ncbi:helix-turn-helix transcriptional regulator [Pseudobacillus sp. FSL P4-0506]|uniref:helix-turn-helix domain-containing protein n=1 Tax=Pseudobacillus sp. FSL P4-0506 TaxID=2921576 RepID=UPI0030FBB118
MIKNRLSVLMAEKGIKSVSELHRMTQEKGLSISRKTLDKFHNNQNNNVAYETLEILCEVLECELHELLVIDKSSKED